MDKLIIEKDLATSSLDLPTIIPKIQQYFNPSPKIYYADFTISVLLGNLFLYIAAIADPFSFLQIIYIFIAAMTLFRATVFMHEIAHNGKSLRGFVIYFNLLHGFLHKIPAYNFLSHRYHHTPRTYGTIEDPEYDALADKSYLYTLVFYPFIVMLFTPIFLIIRWGLLPAFLPFVGPKIRLWIYQYFSTLAIHFQYKRPIPTEEETKQWYRQDAGCFIYSVVTGYLFYKGYLPLTLLAVWYVAVYILTVSNCFRTLMNHRFLTGLKRSTHKQQILDSVTLPLSIVNNVFYPLGLSYHGLHHMFPQIPYHNLKKVHHILVDTLPANHPYHATIIKSFPQGLRKFVTRQL